MARIPLLVGYGGVNPAGRSSGDHGYRRMVIDVLDAPRATATWQSLAGLTGQAGPITPELVERLRRHTLVRELEPQVFDRKGIHWNRRVRLLGGDRGLQFELAARDVPDVIPEAWEINRLDGGRVRVTVSGDAQVLVDDRRVSEVGAAGQLPTGFDPQALYPARSHPRGLQLTVFAASDALGYMGIAWSDVMARLEPDQVCVYAGSAMSQLDDCGNGGLLMSRANGRRVTSKNLALGLAEMPADFVNAYVLGNVGITGHNMGACATFHYNLRAAVNEITSGRARVAVVGAAEASLTPEVMDGYATMGALGTDAGLRALDGITEGDPDFRRACRPFSDNCGFTLAEAAQFVILMDDELALELGAEIYGAVPEVFVNADGNKKSISSPGVGNYITFGKAAALARGILGEEALRRRSFVHAHGTGTPQNRVSESHIFDEIARVHGIEQWPVAAIKCYVGHTVAAAGGDQLINAIGTWRHGWIPGIATIDHIADDVHRDRLAISPQHRQVEPAALDIALLNAKGFGGNNATALVLSPAVAQRMLLRKHGAAAVAGWQQKVDRTRERAAAHDAGASRGEFRVLYNFGQDVRGADDVDLQPQSLAVAGYARAVNLDLASPLAEYAQES